MKCQQSGFAVSQLLCSTKCKARFNMSLVGCKHDVHFKASELSMKAKRVVHIGWNASQKQGVVTKLGKRDYKETTDKACVAYKIMLAICNK
jgi:hypothetical protein